MHAMAPSPSFFLAVNYPWVTYGADFGRSPWGYSGVALDETRQAVASDFAKIRSTGVTVVRWFLLCDGRSGIRYDNGIPVAPDEHLFSDVAAALEIAARSDLRICFSLFDFLWLQTPLNNPQAGSVNSAFPGRNALQFAGGREALLECVLIPLFSPISIAPRALRLGNRERTRVGHPRIPKRS